MKKYRSTDPDHKNRRERLPAKDALEAVAQGAVKGAGAILVSVTDAATSTVHTAIEVISSTSVDIVTAIRKVARGSVSGAASVECRVSTK